MRSSNMPASASRIPLITFGVPTYNVADYLERCVASILAGCAPFLKRIEVLLVDDGSTDGKSPALCDQLASQHGCVRAIHQPNAGHGGAVNTALSEAKGLYFKIVDADDWLDMQACQKLIYFIYQTLDGQNQPDTILVNYVYEHEQTGKSSPMKLTTALPKARLFCWADTKYFRLDRYILMHNVVCLTEMLRGGQIKLPEHTFYVDNIFVYSALANSELLYYLDVDLYRYYIGREGQSVNQDIMASRIDQQLHITRHMIDDVNLDQIDRSNTNELKKMRYLRNYLTMMMVISSVFLQINGRSGWKQEKMELWSYLERKMPRTSAKIRRFPLGFASSRPGKISDKLFLQAYKLSQKLYKFN